MKITRIMKKLKQLKGIKISDKIKKEYRESSRRQAIEMIVINRIMDQTYKPFEKALKRAAEPEIVEKIHIKRLRKLIKKLTLGNGYTTETRKQLSKTIPEIITRIEAREATDADREFIIKDLIPFVQYMKEGERQRLIEKRRLV